jgi:hypothetical protein
MKLIDIDTSDFDFVHDCTFGVEFILADIRTISVMRVWCKKNFRTYKYYLEWTPAGPVRTFCFNSEESRTWFILKFSEYLE